MTYQPSEIAIMGQELAELKRKRDKGKATEADRERIAYLEAEIRRRTSGR